MAEARFPPPPVEYKLFVAEGPPQEPPTPPTEEEFQSMEIFGRRYGEPNNVAEYNDYNEVYQGLYLQLKLQMRDLLTTLGSKNLKEKENYVEKAQALKQSFIDIQTFLNAYRKHEARFFLIDQMEAQIERKRQSIAALDDLLNTTHTKLAAASEEVEHFVPGKKKEEVEPLP